MKKLFYIAFALGLASCSTADHDELVSSPKSAHEIYSSHRITQDEAVSLATSFRNNSQTLSRSGDTDESDVENVVVVRWEDLYPGIPNPVIGDEAPVSRGLEFADAIRPGQIDTLFYVINNKNDAGYTVVSAYDRIAPVYASIEHGNFTLDRDKNSNVQISYRSVDLLLNSLYMEEVEYIEEVVDKSNILVGICIYPKIKTCWGTGQRDLGMGNYHSFSVAVAQIQSYFGLSPANYTNDLNWNLIVEDCRNNKGRPSQSVTKSQMTNLLSFINESLMHKSWRNYLYGCDNQIKDWLDTQNLNISNFASYNKRAILTALEEDKLVCMFGRERILGSCLFNDSTNVWVIDGCDVKVYEDKETGKRSYPQYLHCNWGRGGEANGYYVNKMFDTEDITYLDDKSLGLGYGFRQEDVRYATVSPK